MLRVSTILGADSDDFKKETKMKILLFVALVLLGSFTAGSASAHPGRTDSAGCHTCRTNCESWGLEYAEYHCH